MFERRRRQGPAPAGVAPRPCYIVIATAIGGDTWDVTIPELTGTSTLALSEAEIGPSARDRIATKTAVPIGAFDIDVRRIEYPLRGR